MTREDLIELHRQQVEQFGGQHGVRDWQSLDRVIARAAQAREGVPQAAVLLTEIIAWQPFLDANKRCALNAALVALCLSGRRPSCSVEQAVILIHAIEMREIDFEGVELFLEESAQRV